MGDGVRRHHPFRKGDLPSRKIKKKGGSFRGPQEKIPPGRSEGGGGVCGKKRWGGKNPEGRKKKWSLPGGKRKDPGGIRIAGILEQQMVDR